MKKLLTLLTLLCFTLTYSQKAPKFGKVSLEELQKKQSDLDPEAKAEVLYASNYVTYAYTPSKGFEINEEVYFKVKIYDKDTDWVNQEIDLYKNNSNKETLYGFKANTYNIENEEVVKISVDKKDTFDEEVNDNRDQYKFTFPKVKEGTIIEWKYTKISPFSDLVDEWYFQYGIPAQKIDYTVKIPEFFVVKEDFRRFISPKSQDKSTSSFGDFMENVYEYHYEKVPAAKPEPFLLNVNNYRPSVKFELTGINIPGAIYEDYSNTWDKVNKTLMKSSSFGGKLKPDDELQAVGKQLVEGVTDNDEKISLVFGYVKATMTWNQKLRLRGSKKKLSKVFEEKQGNSAEINMILMQLLEGAGIKSYPVILCTVNRGFLNPHSPSLYLLNHMIVYVENEGKQALMDASEDFSEINILPYKNLNGSGILLLPNNRYQIIPLSNPFTMRIVKNIQARIDEEGEVTGSYTYNSTQYQALKDFQKAKLKANEYEKDVANEYKEIEIENFKVEEPESITRFEYSFDFESDELVQVQGDKLIIDPLFFINREENPLKKDTRNYPLQFENKLNLIKKVTIEIPENYTVQSMPKSISFKMVEGKGSYTIILEQKENKIQIMSNLKINKANYSKQDYPLFKQTFENIVNKENEKIILVQS